MMKIRYSYVKTVVNALFINLKISFYPIDVFNIGKNIKNCRIVSYSTHRGNYNLTKEEVIENFGSEEGCTIYNAKKHRYLVFYNDLNIHYKTPPRRRWTIAHELGHILLNHLTTTNKVKIFRNDLTDDEYEWFEVEANRFASLLLANPIILYKLDIKNYVDIMKICNLSEEASKHRFNDYSKWIKNKYANNYDSTIIYQFYDFIHKKQCLNCGHAFVAQTAKYCPICGHDGLIRGDGTMIYPGYKVTEKGQLMQCIRCQNEEIEESTYYCKICGASVVNECSNCRQPSDSNARYCISCGSETTFYKQGLLPSQEEAAAAINNDFLGPV